MTTFHQENKKNKELVHGGQLNKMAKRYKIPVDQWLDLSTGISPISYPIPKIPTNIWQQLPQENTALINAAKKYYGTESINVENNAIENISVTNGSQAIIARLPILYPEYIRQSQPYDNRYQYSIKNKMTNIDVWLPEVGYKEHEKSWCDAGFTIKQYQQLPTSNELTKNAVVVVINPNNPSGELHSQQTLTALLSTVEKHQGWLIVDEAFMDVISPSQSVIHLTQSNHLFVLRSVGKFFGLAGIRIGFLSAHFDWLEKLKQLASPWEVNGPAQFITEQALKDIDWQLAQQQALAQLTTQLKQLLTRSFIDRASKSTRHKITITGCNLFQTLTHPQAEKLHLWLCRQGVYVRLCDKKNALRFGIPSKKQYLALEKLLIQYHL